MSIKSFKAGTVQVKKDQSGLTIKLGNYSKNSKFATTTQIIIRDSEGKVLADVSDSYLVVRDPRKREGLTEEAAARIPDYIKSELFVIVSDEQK